MDVEKKIRDLLEAPLKRKGYEIYSVKYYRNKGGSNLEITIDRVKPISLDDIVEISDFISPLLDEADPIEEAYTLDISSLGAEKPIELARLQEYVGSYVNLHLSTPYKGENILEGELSSIEEGTVHLSYKIKGKSHTAIFPQGDIDKVRLAIKF